MNKKLVDNKKDKLVKNKATQLEDKNILKKYLNKVNVTYFLLFLFDVVLVIYLARKNIINFSWKDEIFIFRKKLYKCCCYFIFLHLYLFD